jgi:uncharacterized protein YcfL
MRPLLAIALSALMLAGCATYYDKSAVPDASAVLQRASQDCQARAAAHDIKTHSEIAACTLAAERAYYTAVKLKAMYKFDAYAANYQKLAAAWDANRISDRQASFKADRFLGQFYTWCNCGSAQGRFGSVPGAGERYAQEPGFVFNPGPPAASPF